MSVADWASLITVTILSIGGILGVFVRIERRFTTLEVKLDAIKESCDKCRQT